jgi:hypothetical protein
VTGGDHEYPKAVGTGDARRGRAVDSHHVFASCAGRAATHRDDRGPVWQGRGGRRVAISGVSLPARAGTS